MSPILLNIQTGYAPNPKKGYIQFNSHYRPMPFAEFLTHCDWIEGNMVATCFTGIIKLFPEVFERLPQGFIYDGAIIQYILAEMCKVILP